MIHSNFKGPYSLTAAMALTAVFGCQNKIPAPEPENRANAIAPVSGTATTPGSDSRTTPAASTTAAEAASSSSANAAGSAVAGAAGAGDAKSTESAPPRPAIPAESATTPKEGDPLQGKFTLQDAVKGLPKAGKLVADIATDAGTLKCELFEDKAPITVANFVGLARGIRPFRDPKTGEWVKRPAYDDGVFHRIIKGFMIQGGDPTGTGASDGGYVIPDEVWPGATHDRRGLICMANRGKNTNSMQFFIMDGSAKHLDGGYTIFGSCGPDSVIEKLASAEVRGDRAVNPPKIKKVTVKRK